MINKQNEEYAKIFTDAIRKFASNEDALDNFQSYLSCHFDKWLEKFASTPESISAEMKSFSEICIQN